MAKFSKLSLFSVESFLKSQQSKFKACEMFAYSIVILLCVSSSFAQFQPPNGKCEGFCPSSPVNRSSVSSNEQ